MKGQSAIEFISVYGFMLIIAALFIALIVLFAFNAGNSIKTSQCSGFDGFYCFDAQVVYNSVAGNSMVFLSLGTEQSAPVNIIGINVIIENATYSGTCTPNVVVPMEYMNCTVSVNRIIKSGSQIIGSYILNGEYCNSPLYNVTTGSCTYESVIYTGSFSTFSSGNLSRGYLYNIAAPYVVGAITGLYTPSGVAFAPSGAYAYVTETSASGCGFFVSCITDGNVVVISTSTNTVTQEFTPNTDTARGVAIAPSGTYAYVVNNGAGSTPYLEIIDTSTSSKTGSTNMVSAWSPTGVAIAPSGAYAYVTNNWASNVVIFDTATSTMTGTISSSAFKNPYYVAFSPNGNYAYVANSGGGNVLIIDTATGTVTGAITSTEMSDPVGVAVSPDGSYLYITDGSSSKVLVASTTTNTVVTDISSGLSSPLGIAWAPDGSFLYVVNAGSNNVVIMNPGTYK